MADNSSEMRILISGGGIAGLCFALLLNQRGFKNICVLERVSSYADVGFVLGLLPNGSRILKGIGLYEKYLSLGHPEGMNKYQVYNSNGDLLSSFGLDDLNKKYGNSAMVKRSDLVKMFYDECINKNINIRLGTVIHEIIKNDEDCVQVSLKQGDTILDNKEEYDLLVGADGLRSKTRKLVFGNIPLNYFNFTGWGFWVDKTPEIDITAIQEYWGKGKVMGLYPHSDEIVAVFCGIQAPRATPDPPEKRIAKLKNEFNEFGGIIHHIVETLPDPETMWHDDFLEVEMPGNWYKNRVVLIGDACHAVLPTAGAGASLALESAFVLTEELCKCGNSSFRDLQLGLKLFQKRRIPRVKAVRKEGHHIAKAYSVTNALLVYARNKVVQVAGNSMSMLFSDKFSEIVETPI